MKLKTVKLMLVLLCTTLTGFAQEQQEIYPSSYLGDTVETGIITKATFLANPVITARMEISPENTEEWTVSSFQISLIERGMESVSISVQGNKIPQNVLNSIQEMTPPFVVHITGIRAAASGKKPRNPNDLMFSIKE
jgi:hypothetical protein